MLAYCTFVHKFIDKMIDFLWMKQIIFFLYLRFFCGKESNHAKMTINMYDTPVVID